nr:unnamed protein product [Callosobruchus chinensis]
MFHLRSKKYYKPRRSTCHRDFKALYRFGKENVEWLSNNFLGVESEETRGSAICNTDKKKILLRYVADPAYQTGVAEDIGDHRTSVSKVVTKVADQMIEKRGRWIKFPSTSTDVTEAKRRWQRKYTFPCAVGVIDCTHIKIKKPPLHGDEYINRKAYHSINVQATYNAYEWFTSVDASWPGSVHDSRICKVAKGEFQRSNALLL